MPITKLISVCYDDAELLKKKILFISKKDLSLKTYSITLVRPNRSLFLLLFIPSEIIFYFDVIQN